MTYKYPRREIDENGSRNVNYVIRLRESDSRQPCHGRAACRRGDLDRPRIGAELYVSVILSPKGEGSPI